MHRSGTSALTRGLLALGVNLSDKLISPLLGDNNKGFYEDGDINKINIELLNKFDSDWPYVSSIDQLDLTSLEDLIAKAVQILAPTKITDKPFWYERSKNCFDFTFLAGGF